MKKPVDTIASNPKGISRWRSECRLVLPLRMSRMRGFTLLEILLVVAILAVLLVLGIRMLHGQASRSQVEHAGQELQAVMQAAIYYHSVNHGWPDQNSHSSCMNDEADQKFVQYYLPKDANGAEEKTRFGTYYCWQEHTTTGSDDENGALFDLYLPVKGARACQLARQIAGTVPNAEAVSDLGDGAHGACGDESLYFVRAQVVPSAKSIEDNGGQSFRAIGQCVPENTPECSDDESFVASGNTCCHVSGSIPTQYKIHFAVCKPSQTQKIVYLPAFITYMNSKGKASYTPLQPFDRDYIHTTVDPALDPSVNRLSNPEPTCYSDTNQLICTLTLGVGVKTQNSGVIDTTNSVASAAVAAAYSAGSVGAVYMASCVDK